MNSRGQKAAASIAGAIALACSGLALASEDRHYYGPLDEAGSVEFSLRKGEAPKVRRVEITFISADCGKDGTGRFNFRIKGSAPVRDDRTFVVRSQDGTGGRAKVSGRFSDDYASAEGKVRVRGKFKNSNGKGSARCDSGKQKFVAR